MDIDALLNNDAPKSPSSKEDLIADLCSIEVAIPASYPDPIPVLCCLEFGTMTETLIGTTFTVGVTGAKLRLDPIGYNINKSNKFGSIKILEAVKINYGNNSTRENRSESKVGLKTSLVGELGISEHQVDTYANNYSISYDHHYVKASSNNCWSIQSLPKEGEYLNGDYLGGGVICYLTPVGTANMKSLNASLEVTPAQIEFHPVAGSNTRYGLILKHPKLIQALVAKRVRGAVKLSRVIEKHASVITMSLVEISDDLQ